MCHVCEGRGFVNFMSFLSRVRRRECQGIYWLEPHLAPSDYGSKLLIPFNRQRHFPLANAFCGGYKQSSQSASSCLKRWAASAILAPASRNLDCALLRLNLFPRAKKEENGRVGASCQPRSRALWICHPQLRDRFARSFNLQQSFALVGGRASL